MTIIRAFKIFGSVMFLAFLVAVIGAHFEFKRMFGFSWGWDDTALFIFIFMVCSLGLSVVWILPE